MCARRRRGWSPIERDLRGGSNALIAGVDEVGRGPLAGPVVASAVIMPPGERAIRGVNDSKALAPRERERLARLISERAVAIGIGAASVHEIDRFNIYQASVLAMRRALGRLRTAPDHVLVDGLPIRTLPVAHTAVVKGDAKCFAIACASIIAKVTRDRLMSLLAARYPGYAWEHNVGYATERHISGLQALGLTPHHRRSFLSVRTIVGADFQHSFGFADLAVRSDDEGDAERDDGAVGPNADYALLTAVVDASAPAMPS